MQEAFGGTFMLKLFMIFFIIYVAFIGVALNFAKIYRIKNNVINILEQDQYVMGNGNNNTKVYTDLGKYLDSVPYGYSDAQGVNFNSYCKSNIKDSNNNVLIETEYIYKTYGVCVIQKGEEDKPYYSVSVYYVINFPVLNVLNLPITASGETIVIKSHKS